MRGFTLFEVLIAGWIFVFLIGIVVQFQSLSGNVVGRMVWHNNVNQQGNAAQKYISRAFEKTSVPAVVSSSGFRPSTNLNHRVYAPAGATVTAGIGDTVILTIPMANPCIPPNPGQVTWVDVVISPGTAGLGNVGVRETVQAYSDSNFDTIADPGNGALKTLLEGVETVGFQLSGERVLQVSMKAVYPKDKKVSQTFSMSFKSNIEVKIRP